MVLSLATHLAAVAAAVSILGGCGAHHQNRSPHPVAPPASEVGVDRPEDALAEDASAKSVPPDERAAPPVPSPAPPRTKRTSTLTAEAWDPRLAAALKQLEATPSAEHARVVGEIYRNLGVLDTAHKYLSQAVDEDRTNAKAFDGLARVWRAWGLLYLGLGDAHRARYHAPTSPVVHNTLGTILQDIGQHAAAQQAYEQALALEPRSPYALNNLCYLSFLQGKPETAIPQCRAALELAPGLTTARHNLALAYAATDRMDLASQELHRDIDQATAQFNLGMILMAKQQYLEAVDAFDAARTARSSFFHAATMARHASTLAERHAQGGPK